MTESEFADKLNQMAVENRNLRRTIGRQQIEIGELLDAAEIRKWIEWDVRMYGLTTRNPK